MLLTNHDTIETLIDHVQMKLLKRSIKGDKQSLNKNLSFYKNLNLNNKLDPRYLDFHTQNITNNKIPDYIVPIIFQEIQLYDSSPKSMNREEKRDSDIMKLFGCRYYSTVFCHIKHFSFVKSKHSKSKILTDTPQDVSGLENDDKALIQCRWDAEYNQASSDQPTSPEVAENISDIIFERIKESSAAILFEYQSNVIVIALASVHKSRGNKKYVRIYGFNFVKTCSDIKSQEETDISSPNDAFYVLEEHVYPDCPDYIEFPQDQTLWNDDLLGNNSTILLDL